MKILVTGGAGFIGSNFVEFLLEEQHSLSLSEIRVLDKLTYAGSKSNLENIQGSEDINFIRGDICDKKVVRSAIKGIDLVIHLAAESHVDRSITTAERFYKTNVLGTQVVLEESFKSGVQKVIQVSSDEVYGSITSGSFHESALLRPSSPYAASKASADMLALAYFVTFGLNVCITRASNNFGKRQHPEKLIPRLITNIIKGVKVPIYGTGGNIRNWLHVKDHCRAIILAAELGVPGEIYNISGILELTNLELTRHILDYFGLKDDWIKFVADRPGHDFRYAMNSTKALLDLGYSPQISLLDNINETISWYRENQQWWIKLSD